MPNKDETVKDELESTPEKKPKSEAKPAMDMRPKAPVTESKPVKSTPVQDPKPQPPVDSTEPEADKPKKDPAKKRALRSTLIKVASIVVTLLAIVVIVFGILIYVYKSENPAVKVVGSVVPYPVERVNWHIITYKSYLFEVDANMRAYQNNAKLNNQPAVDFNSEEGKKLATQIKQHALEKLANDSLMAQLADSKDVKVTDKEVNELVEQLYTRYGGKDTLLKTLDQIYGWDLKDLEKVVYKQLLAKNLEEKITSDPALDAAAKAKAQELLKKVKAGEDFGELAKKNSQASDASNGGDLGFFTKGQLPDELQKAAEALQPGQVSDPVRDQYGYELIKVLEKKDDGSIRAQHILIKTIDFNEYFEGELKKAKVSQYLKV